MASLLHPLQSASQKCRPKHQVLVLRCYPKYQKNVQEIKPNSSELSYLLYYVSTRRSKLMKVGAFLEKKTASDVWRVKLGNVQVTLQVLSAIIEKTPRDLSLYANSVLSILETVVRSKDITMVEESLPTFEAYCKNVDAASLLADQARSRQYLNLVYLYANYATPEEVTKIKQGQSVPLSIRWRTAALRAIRAVVGSDALAADSAAQLNLVVPVILENLSLEEEYISKDLQVKAQVGEKQSLEVARRRRLSVATVSTIDTTDLNPVGAETTADADKVAEEEVRVLAIRCLKQIFSVSTSSTRGQTRLATALTLRFVASKPRPPLNGGKDPRTGLAGNWATSLFEAIARWTPVQDRFVIIVTAMETLTRSRIVESVLEKQLVLAGMIDWLLRSDINLIGLSVMDVLLGLIQHTLLLLQLGGRDSKIAPHAQQGDILGIYQEAHDTFDPGDILTHPDQNRDLPDETTPSPMRKELLFLLERCISDLGTHIYYTDQITDMITAILARLKPSAQSEVSSTTAAINNPAATSKAIADSISLQEDPSTDGFFSFAMARVIALKAVKNILVTANSKKSSTGTSAEARSRVGVQVWEGTQWLLKDEEQTVRFAYIEALLAWLKQETNRSDTLLPKDGIRRNKHTKKELPNGEEKLVKRAVSNASKREPKPVKSTFHQLLNLAIHDNILDMAESEADILALFLLMTTMVERLGVNSIRFGLPMIMTLQNTALNGSGISSTRGKVNVASLVHGYLWSIAEKFDLETTRQGHEISGEIARRKRLSVWLDRIKVQPLSMDQVIQLLTYSEKEPAYAEASVDTLKPFFDVTEFVNEIAYSYNNSLLTPPSSPPASPGRVFSVPTLGFGYGYGFSPASKPLPEDQIPQRVKDEMSGQWSRESCIANLEKESAGSVTGSRTGGSSRGNHHLQVTSANGGVVSGRESPGTPQDGAAAQPIVSGLGSLSKQRQFGRSGSDINLTTTSSRDSTMRVSDLKRALASFQNGIRNESPLRRPTTSRRSVRSQDSESMVSWNEADDFDAPPGDANGTATESVDGSTQRPGTSRSLQKASVHEQTTLGARGTGYPVDDDIPPVPKIPSTLNLPGTWPRDPSPTRPQTARAQPQIDVTDTANASSKRVISSSYASVHSSKVGGNKRSSRPASRAGGASVWSEKRVVSSKVDLSDFLAGIETDGGASESNKENGEKRLTIPPY